MSDLLDITKRLQATQAAIARHEKAAREHPEFPSLASGLQSLYKRRDELETLFASVTNENFIDICSYRIFTWKPNEQPTINGLTSALSDFQAVFTTTYDSITNGAKQRAHASAEVNAATSFGFGYTFPGSVGFVLTLPNERLLVDETHLDQAMNTVFAIAQAESSEQIAEWVSELGAAPIKKVYEWITDLIDSGLGADIDWRRDEEVKASLFIELPQLRHLQQLIAQTGTETEEEITVTGDLIGIDAKRHTFHMRFEPGAEVSGKMNVLLDEANRAEIPKRYTARIRKTTRVNFAKPEDDIEYFLLSLE